jgi:hypothetical protein
MTRVAQERIPGLAQTSHGLFDISALRSHSLSPGSRAWNPVCSPQFSYIKMTHAGCDPLLESLRTSPLSCHPPCPFKEQPPSCSLGTSGQCTRRQPFTEILAKRAGERKCIPTPCGSRRRVGTRWKKGKPTSPETSDANIFFRSSSSLSSLSVASLDCKEESAPLQHGLRPDWISQGRDQRVLLCI